LGQGDSAELTRHDFLAATGAAAGGLWLAGQAPAATAASCATPNGFPAGLALSRQTFVNWAREIRVDDVWTAAPRTPADVAAVANWAARHGWRVRARGMMHGWSPLTVVPGSSCAQRTLLLDTTKHLTGVEMRDSTTVRAQAGATLDAVLAVLEQHGRALVAAPAPGDITVGGALAINAHGTAIPARGESRPAGGTYGSLSNLIRSLTAVVWSTRRGRYVLRRFDRDDPAIAPLLVHIGRAFVVEAELASIPLVPLRCQSFMDIPASELFAPPGATGRTLASFLEETGRVETILFPFTDHPWLKVWSVSPVKPAASRQVTAPYNYPFANNIPTEVSELARSMVEDNPAATPLFGQLIYDVSTAGLIATGSADIWGAPKNSQLYVRPTTLRETANGYAVLCRRADIQRAVHEFSAFFLKLQESYRARGLYPANIGSEIRVTGIDHRGDVGIPKARTATLSALRPHNGHPDRNVAVWFDVFCFPTTPGAQPFYRDIERWFFANYRSYGHVRPEWSKGWGYSGTAGWSDRRMLRQVVPNAYRAGVARHENFDSVRRHLGSHDPHGIYGNALLDRLFA
jgi:FAD/FMN-containing dehydrogenase